MLGIVPAAGSGVRFKELGKQYPKCILPYKEKPLLIWNIEFMLIQGCTEIKVIVNHRKEKVQEIIDMYYDNSDFIILVEQKEKSGLSSAILSGLDGTKTEVLIVLGDLISKTKEKLDLKENFVTVQRVSDFSRWCMVSEENGTVKDFYDKPESKPPTNFSLNGIYFFKDSTKLKSSLEKQMINSTKISGELQFSTAMEFLKETEPIKILEKEVIDFGTLEEYLSNRKIKTSRSFNDILEEEGLITKKSSQTSKLYNEYNWFNILPNEISIHTPKIYCENLLSEGSYTMERIYSPSLREIFLFLDSSEETWGSIFDSLFSVIHKMKKYKSNETIFMKNMFSKTKERIQKIEIPIENVVINNFLSEFELMVSTDDKKDNIIHGDFCFSNILCDLSKSNNSIKMIDPRGEIYGSSYYDVAKICHSVFYDYDFIDSELYFLKGDYRIYNDGKMNIKKLFYRKLKLVLNLEELKYIRYITASLFLSMIPLHSHNRNNQIMYYNKFKEIYLGGSFEKNFGN